MSMYSFDGYYGDANRNGWSCLNTRPSATGTSTVVIGTPEGAAKVYRAEGKYPVRSAVDESMDWIYKKKNFITMIFTYVHLHHTGTTTGLDADMHVKHVLWIFYAIQMWICLQY